MKARAGMSVEGATKTRSLMSHCFGTALQPAVVTVGTWDPLLSTHISLLQQQATYAAKSNMSAVAVILEPSPAAVIHPGTEWPVFDDVVARRRRILGLGVEAVIQVDFRRADLESGALELVKCLFDHVQLAELWLGDQQTLGRGPSGNRETTERLAASSGFHIRRLPRANDQAKSQRVRNELAKGDIAAAAKIVGHFPQWHKPPSGTLQLGWMQGGYMARDISSNDGVADSGQQNLLRIKLRKDPETVSGRYFTWPKGCHILEFHSGPQSGAQRLRRSDAGVETYLEDRHDIILLALADEGFRRRLATGPREALEGLGISSRNAKKMIRELVIDGNVLVPSTPEGKSDGGN